MPNRPLTAVLRYLRPFLGEPELAERNDRDLLSRFVQQHDEAAFTTLVRRHGPMVLGVCRRLLSDEHAAEDAFQATFLVLLRRAGSVPWREVVGSWLYQVACRTAQKARVQAALRQAREREAGQMRATAPATATDPDLHEVLDHELQRLPAKYRLPLVLCYLEGRNKTEAARELGWKEGTVSSRLARGREMLRQRLGRRGLALAGAALLLGPERLSAAVSPALEAALVREAVGLATGSATTSAGVASLAQAVVTDLFMARLKLTAGLLMAVALLGLGAGVVISSVWQVPEVAEQPAPLDNKPAAPGRPGRTDAFGDPLPEGALFRLGTVRLQHGDWLSHLEFSRRGTELHSSSGDGSIRMWDTATGEELRRFPMRPKLNIPAFHCFTLSPDGRTLAANHEEHLCLWDTATGKLLARCEEPSICFAFAADGKELMAVYPKRVVHYQVPSGKQMRQWDHEFAEFGFGCAFSADRKLLAIADRFHKVGVLQLWDTSAGEKLREIKHPADGGLNGLAFVPDGTMLASANDKGVVRLWSVAAGKNVRDWQTRSSLNPLAMSADGRTLAIASEEKLKLYDWHTGKEMHALELPRFNELEGGRNYGGMVAFSPDGKVVATEGPHKSIRMWNVETGKEIQPLAARPDKFLSLDRSLDGRILITKGDQEVALWEAETGRLLRRFSGYDQAVVRPDGAVVALRRRIPANEKAAPNTSDPDAANPPVIRQMRPAGTADPAGSTVHLVEIATGKELTTLRRADRPKHPFVSPIGWSADGQFLATGASKSDDSLFMMSNRVDIWNVHTGKIVHEYEGQRVLCSSNLQTVAVATCVKKGDQSPDQLRRILDNEEDEYKIRLFKAITGKELPRPPSWHVKWGIESRSLGPVLSANGKILAVEVESNCKKICLWDCAAGMPLADLRGDDYRGGDFQWFSADTKLLAVTDQGRQLSSILRLAPSPCAISPDGKLLAFPYYGDSGGIRLLETATGKEIYRLDGPKGVSLGNLYTTLEFANARVLCMIHDDHTVVAWDLTGRLQEGRPETLTLQDRDLVQLWNALGDENPKPAYRAIWHMVAGSRQAVPYLKGRLRPVAAPDEQRLQRLVTDLDSNEFDVRHRATQKLEQLGELAEPALQKALAAKPNLELHQRIQRLLDRVDDPSGRPELLRGLRGIQVIEYAATPEAKELLAKLADGTSQARLTQEARAALARLGRRAIKP